jgi:Lon protease-like protein
MSDAMEKVRGIRELPIFPLPLVMVPNELLPLHIFEPRYRQMLADIENRGRFFGVVLFETAESFEDRPAVGTIGCVAEIRESEQLEDGRSNILSIGVVRFRLLEYIESDKPYFVADVEFFEDEIEADDATETLADEVFGLFERMAKAAFKMSSGRGQLPQIQRTDPESLSFLITTAFSFDNERKYRLLEMTSTKKRLTELREVLNQAVVQIESNAEIQTVAKTNGHSKKKISL